jgi:cytochrome P450
MSGVAVEIPEAAVSRGVLGSVRAWLQRRRERREDAFSGIPRAAFNKPIHRVLTPLGLGFWLNDPTAIKRVLVDNVANYSKTALERRFFAAVFGDGLLSTDGETWRAHRRIMAPSFDPRSVAAYAPTMAAASERFAARWTAMEPGAEVDMAAEMTALTLEIIAQTMFSTSSARLAWLINETVQNVLAANSFSLLDIAPVIGGLRLKARDARMRAIFAELDAALDRLIAEREMDAANAPMDLLGRLLAAKDAETGAGMTAREVRDQVVTIFLAGHDTTAGTMTWVWYLLARNPAEAARLHAELGSVLAGRTPTAEDVQRLPYTRMVIEEAMRLYPVAPGVSDRQARAADTLAGVRVPKGALVFINSWVLHRNPALWPDPERFDPERFSSERSKDRPRHAYIPFGAGPRVCIGAALATTEAVLILAVLAQRYRPTLVSERPVRLQHKVTLHPRGGLPMRLVRRGA